eukprot:CAMPEP_0170577362 /NCGR_PEP_ID=MMETSP0224-20130122/4887_1 /TAXON_ID=285029 /ORGANISM="Togula jolla, Strain CCCM 725" /LENGTH=30 /DNA_ID= /DNA_START= /DNA_END= /DNA_ORIENTATION=
MRFCNASPGLIKMLSAVAHRTPQHELGLHR